LSIQPSEIEPALEYLAYVIASTGETQHMPLLEKLEREPAKYRTAAEICVGCGA
jgi:hypothetical protein